MDERASMLAQAAYSVTLATGVGDTAAQVGIFAALWHLLACLIITQFLASAIKGMMK